MLFRSPCNVSTLLNEYQNYTGWVELYNPSASSVNIKGYTFINNYTSNNNNPKSNSWTIDTDIIIPAKGYKILFFDGEDGAEHAPWKIETNGGFLLLNDASNNQIGFFEYSRMYAHVSWGRASNLDEFDNNQGYMFHPTPNDVNVKGITSSLRVAKPQFSVTPGFMTSSKSWTITTTESGESIYYTTNGSEPTLSSTKYTDPISIS